ncbi:hypothetical protein V5H98_02070 [Georgenia sp. M64]|uniref:hypothetical protein n=1 Tax=Georgenia sp. M64 TaxID=3120520 RepID=UPI0030E10A61
MSSTDQHPEPDGRPADDTTRVHRPADDTTRVHRPADDTTRVHPPADDHGVRTPAEPSTRREDTETTATRRQGFLGLRGDGAASPVAPTGRRDAAPAARQPEPRERTVGRDPLLDGATETRPRSRAAAHGWALLLTLVLAPVAWYLVTDAGARLTLGADNQWQAGEITNPAALVELAAGLVVTAALLLAARWSSLGATTVGAVVLVLALVAVALPAQATTFLDTLSGTLGALGSLGDNAAFHLDNDVSTGRLALYGLGLLVVGVVSHGARRLGRREERLRTPR